MITNYQTTRITLLEKYVIKNVTEAFADIFNDYQDDLPQLVANAKMYTDILRNIQNGEVKNSFCEGFTSLLVGGRNMEYIEEFFSNLRKDPHSGKILEIVVVDDRGNKQTVEMDYIQYWYMICRDINEVEIEVGDTCKFRGYPYLFEVIDIVEDYGYVQVEIKPAHGGAPFLASEDDIELV